MPFLRLRGRSGLVRWLIILVIRLIRLRIRLNAIIAVNILVIIFTVPRFCGMRFRHLAFDLCYARRCGLRSCSEELRRTLEH